MNLSRVKSHSEYAKAFWLAVAFVCVLMPLVTSLSSLIGKVSFGGVPSASGHHVEAAEAAVEEVVSVEPADAPGAGYDIEALLAQAAKEGDKTLYLFRQPETRAAVEWFYIQVVGNREVALAILEAADEYDISPSLAFALAHTESQYKVTARHENKNGSIDRGLFQLNNRSFPSLSEEQFFDPRVSAHYGMSHLKTCLKVAGNEITAIAMYNAGTNKVHDNRTPKMTLDYISKIENYKATLDSTFNQEVLAYYGSVRNSDWMLAKY